MESAHFFSLSLARQGDIASAASSYLYVWTINGQLLATINTMAYSRQQSILCVAMSQVRRCDRLLTIDLFGDGLCFIVERMG